MTRAAIRLGIALVLLLAACRGGTEPAPGAPAATPTSEVATPAPPAGGTAVTSLQQPQPPTPTRPTGPLGLGSLALAPAFGGKTFERPVELLQYLDGTLEGTFLLADLSGVVTRLASDGRVLGTFLDQRSVTLRSGNEEGLLSVALDPAFASNRYVYIYASRGSPRRTMLARCHLTHETLPRMSKYRGQVPRPEP